MASAEECLLAVIQNDEAALMGSEPDQGRLVMRRRFNDPDLRHLSCSALMAKSLKAQAR